MKKILALLLTCLLLVNTFAFTASLASTETEVKEGFFPGWATKYRLEQTLPATPVTFTAEVRFPIEYNYAGTNAEGERIPGVGGSLIANNDGSAGSVTFSVDRGYPRLAWADPYEAISPSDNRNMIFKFDDIDTGKTVTYQGKEYPVTPMYTGETIVLTITVDHTNKKVSCYIDGELKQTIKYDDEETCWDNYGNLLPITASYVNGPKAFRNSGFVVGGGNTALNRNYLRGINGDQVSLNKIALFSTARSATQIKADYDAIVNEQQPADAFIYFDFKGYPDEPDMVTDVTGKYTAPKKARYMKSRADIDGFVYSMAFIGDTQKVVRFAANYDGNNPEGINQVPNIYDWILEHKEAEKIEYVIGLGDITDVSHRTEWDIAVPQINRLSAAFGNNYIAIQGNHDRRGSYTSSPYDYNYNSSVHVTYDDAFKGTSYEKSIPSAQRYKSNSILNFYKKVNLGGVPYMFVCLEYAAPDAVLEWASSVVSANPNYNVIVVTHAYSARDGQPLTWNSGTTPDDNDTGNTANSALKPFDAYVDDDNLNNGLEIWHRFVKKHKNISMVVSGHIGSDDIVVTDKIGDNKNTVKQVLIDHQDIDRHLIEDGVPTDNPRGLGVVALMYFMGDGKTIKTDAVSTFRAYSEDYSAKPYFDENNRFSFELQLNGTKGGDFSSSSAGKPDGYCTIADVLYVIDEVLNDKGYKCDTNGDGIATLADVLRVISCINK